MSLCVTNSEVTQVEMARKLSWQHQQASVQCVTRDRQGKVLANAKTAKTLKVFFYIYIFFIIQNIGKQKVFWNISSLRGYWYIVCDVSDKKFQLVLLFGLEKYLTLTFLKQ